MIFGLDNGLNGGIVALSPLHGLAPIAKYPLPTMEVTYPARKTTEAKTTREIDARALVGILDEISGTYREQITVFFETCPFHADRAEVMRSMALSAGKITAILEAKSYKVVRILSYDWHPVILGKVPRGHTKSYALAKARELWPEENWLASERSKIPHDGMIDAALIAEYGRRITYPEFPEPFRLRECGPPEHPPAESTPTPTGVVSGSAGQPFPTYEETESPFL